MLFYISTSKTYKYSRNKYLHVKNINTRYFISLLMVSCAIYSHIGYRYLNQNHRYFFYAKKNELKFQNVREK